MRSAVITLAACSSPSLLDAPATRPPTSVQSYISVATPRVVIAHVRVIDGLGHPAVDDRNVTVDHGKITAIDAGADVAPAAGLTVVDGRGGSVMPGLVGMHDHLFYIARPNADEEWASEPPVLLPEMMFSSPRLYLAAGVTTLRTTGSVEPYAELNLRADIEAGTLVGPHLDVTGPYLEGASSPFIQMHHLRDADEARTFVAYWADRGVTSFKAYMNLTRAELAAAIDEVHKRGLKITGHLCAVSYDEAADLGIDDLEHGFFVNTQLDPGKTPDVCPDTRGTPTLLAMAPDGAEAKALIGKLVAKHVAITSRLPVFESSVPGRPPLRRAQLDAMTPEARTAYLYMRARPTSLPPRKFDPAAMLARDMALERAFVAAGGLLLAGPDPQRRRSSWLRRPARARAARRGRVLTSRGDPDRHAQRRGLPRPRRDRQPRGRQGRRPRARHRQSGRAHRRHRERARRVPRRLRPGEAARIGDPALRGVLNAAVEIRGIEPLTSF